MTDLRTAPYAVSISKNGTIATIETLDIVEIEKEAVTSVTTSKGVTTFVANGKTYEVIGAENAENVTVEFATVAPAAKNGTKYELVVFDGKVAVTTGGFIEEAESTIPAFDGWGQILEAEIKFTPSDETDSMLGDEETAPVVEYAKVKVLNNKGELTSMI